jgi:diguanylate cyclase (GGDEF)-like protein
MTVESAIDGLRTACDREPIHLPGSIQPFGALIVVDAAQTVVQISANSGQWLGMEPRAALGRSLAALFGEDFAQGITQALTGSSYSRGNMLPGPQGLGLGVSVHSFDELDFIEFEAVSAERPEDIAAAQRMVTGLRRARTSELLAAEAARQVREMTALDRVMVYRFGEDAHGEVVAEALAEDQEPFLGLHYPAADIPVQARRMYLLQRIRYIGDVDYQPVPMAGWAGFESPVDMTYCSLRSVSPIHLEYLRNMGVSATLAMSLVIDDRLWGMIVCHHRQPIALSPSKRALCDLAASLTSALLGARLRTEAMTARLARQQMIAAFAERLQSFDRVAAALVDQADDLLALTDSQGAYIKIGGEVHLLGVTPDVVVARQILATMQTATSGAPFATTSLARDYPDIAAGEIAGALAMPISHNPQDGIVWFRQEVLENVLWGGNPAEAKAQSDGRLSPRTSFAAWSDTVRSTSHAWTEADLASATELRRLVTATLLRQTEQQLAVLSRFDPLTGLHNRRALNERLARLDANSGTAALLFLDLDRFKTVNDSLGHAAGDALLVQVSDRLKEAVGESGITARLGGDEFVVLLVDADEHAGRVVASRILDTFHTPFLIEDRPHRAKTSIGMAVTPSVANVDLLRAADAAMYASKREGGSTLTVYEESLHADMVERLRLEQDLFVAGERDEFKLVFQPIVCSGTESIIGFEALLRWQHPERGLLAPSTFIPLAEETGQIVAIGKWVLQTAVSNITAWNARFGLDLFVTINVAPQQLAQPDFVGAVLNVLIDHQATPETLVVEVTESTIMDRSAVLRLETLRKLGVSIAIDDFGTGFSNLAYLRDLPADKVKIDRRFVTAAALTDDDRAFFNAMVNLVRTTGMTVIAEGVESREECDVVEAAGCDLIQGYLFGRPMAVLDVESMLSNPLFARSLGN